MLLNKKLYMFLLRDRIALYLSLKNSLKKFKTHTERVAYQLSCFNKIWREAYENIPFYAEWRTRFALPEKINSLDDLSSWPVLTKNDLRKLEKFKRLDVPIPKGRILTGGSTGTPVRLPVWPDKTVAISQMVGRARYGVNVGDKVFLLWGHEHLYGVGVKRIINIFKRRVKDWLADWKRVSAYDLSHKAMVEAFRKLEVFCPSVIIAYSPAIVSFCRQNSDKKGVIRSVRTVICSAGPLSQEEKREVSEFFANAKICMEYGTVECGVIGYTRPEDDMYEIFWNTHLVQAHKDSSGESRAIITRLTDCYVPLIRYDVGDYLELTNNEDACESVFVVKNVKGRPTELLQFASGIEFFAWTVGDCVKQVSRIVSHQIAVDEARNKMEIRVIADDKLTDDELYLPIDRLSRIIQDLDRISLSVVQVEKLFTTVGGKVPRVIRP